MPFNYRNTLQYNPISPNIIAGASRSPFSIAGEEMTNLSNAIDDRNLKQQLGQAKSLEDVIGLTSSTPTGMQMLQQAQNKFNILDQMKRQEPITALNQAKAENYIDALNRYKTNLGLEQQVQAQDATLPQIGGGKFTALTTPTTPVYDERTRLEDLKTLGKYVAPTSTGTRKPTSFEERDRWFNELQGLRSRPNLTPAEQERARFLETGILGFQAGQSEVREGLDVGDYKKVKSIGNKLLSGQELPEGTDRYASELGFKDTKAYGTQLQKKEQEFFNNVENISALNSLSERLEGSIANGTFNTGVLDNLKTSVAKLTPENMRSFTGMTPAQIMETTGLQGQMGMALADYLKTMSGTAASEAEAKRRLTDMFGGDWSQEDIKANVFRNFISKEKEKALKTGENLVKRGLVGDVYDAYKELEGSATPRQTKKPKATEFKVGQRAVQNGKTYEYTADGWKEI